jgi:hypothetical protein
MTDDDDTGLTIEVSPWVGRVLRMIGVLI